MDTCTSFIDFQVLAYLAMLVDFLLLKTHTHCRHSFEILRQLQNTLNSVSLRALHGCATRLHRQLLPRLQLRPLLCLLPQCLLLQPLRH